MWKIPDTITGFIFGTGALPLRSDIGYVKVLFMAGIVGVVMLVIFYIYMISVIKSKSNSNIKYQQEYNNPTIINISKAIRIIVALIFLLNFKALFLFARNIHELIIILFFAFLADINKERLLKNNDDIQLSVS